jgi:hypothetical protein
MPVNNLQKVVLFWRSITLPYRKESAEEHFIILRHGTFYGAEMPLTINDVD